MISSGRTEPYEASIHHVTVVSPRVNGSNDGRLADCAFDIEHLEKRIDILHHALDGHQLTVIDDHRFLTCDNIHPCVQFPVLTLPGSVDITSMFGEFAWIPYAPHSSVRIAYDEDSPSMPSVPKKKLLWQLEYKSVPYYIRTFANQLFVGDRYGSIRSKRD